MNKADPLSHFPNHSPGRDPEMGSLNISIHGITSLVHISPTCIEDTRSETSNDSTQQAQTSLTENDWPDCKWQVWESLLLVLEL